MASLLGAFRRPTIVADTPVPYVPRSTSVALHSLLADQTAEQYMRAYGSVGTLFAIVHRLANATAQVDWKLYRKSVSGDPEDRAEVTVHPALALWNTPNLFMPQQEFLEGSQQHLDLTGEAWWIVVRAGKTGPPVELWPVRPDRMQPVPHPTDYLSGYLYLSPDGERVPLRTDEVIMLRMPNPLDTYRGLGPVQSILADLDSTKYSAEWNRNFFLNSAEPGGILESPEFLDDDQYRQLLMRWREQHRGVANAHRVAIVEGGLKWVDRKYTQRDMQFAELRGVSSEVIREAFGFPKPMLGTVEDVNRANAEAGEVVFARWLVVPRLERIKQALNARLLPMFGARDLEFDYVNPVPADRAADAAELTSKAEAASKLVTAGWEPAAVLETVGLPEMAFKEPPAPEPPAVLPPAQDELELAAFTGERVRVNGRFMDERAPRALAAARPALPDLGPVQDAWRAALDDLLERWAEVRAAQQQALADQIRVATDRGDPLALAGVAAPTGAAVLVLTAAMVALAAAAADHAAAEADDAGVPDVHPVEPQEAALAVVAIVIAGTLAAEMTISAVREAIRQPPGNGDDVAGEVLEHLRELSLAGTEKQLGGALTVAQNAGRLATYAAADSVITAYYASEELDSNTCAECRKIDGKWLGNTVDAAAAQYPAGGFRACLGGVRCRGQVVAIWRGGDDSSKFIEKEPV